MTKAEKIEFVSNWKLEKKEVLEDGGLGEPKLGAVSLKFFSGILFSTLGARKALPFLQQVFQADVLRKISIILIIHNPSRIMHKKGFLLYIIQLE
jgi:hypothetical protein